MCVPAGPSERWHSDEEGWTGSVSLRWIERSFTSVPGTAYAALDGWITAGAWCTCAARLWPSSVPHHSTRFIFLQHLRDPMATHRRSAQHY